MTFAETCMGFLTCGLCYVIVMISTTVVFMVMNDDQPRWIKDIFGVVSAAMAALFGVGLCFAFGWMLGTIL